MRKLLLAMFVALLMVGCGGPDLDDKENLDEIIAGAIDSKKLQERGKKGEKISYAPNKQTPYTGWAKVIYDNGQINGLWHYKDGKLDGLATGWYESGQKSQEENYKDGKEDGLLTEWYESGQKSQEKNYKDGKEDGLWTSWYENGQKMGELNWKDGKEDGLFGCWYESGQIRFVAKIAMGEVIKAKSWKPNGEKCPHTEVVNGNGIMVWHNVDGTKRYSRTFKGGYDGRKDSNGTSSPKASP
jgi:antitoxin component YwqK of YwqJK toxin-antitoxin module